MKPLQLKIQGLNSIIEEQVIPFEPLVSKGLFGIFGPTGSGKSTILDGMILALYGEIPRDTKEFINSECDQLSVSYTFALHQGEEEKIYAVERNIKKDNQSYRTTLVRFYEMDKEGDKQVISEGARPVRRSVEELIGLTMEDFTRSVVLPQGKFSDFLKLSGSERRNMLERLFDLEEYGQQLREKIRKTKRKHQDQQLVLETQLSYYQDVSKEAHTMIQEEYKALQEQKQILQQQWKNYTDQYERWEKQWNDQKEYTFYQHQQQEHQEQKNEIESMKEKLTKSRQSEQLLPHVLELQKIEKKLEELEKQQKVGEEKSQFINQALMQIETQYQEALKKKNETYPQLLKKQQELERAIELQKELQQVVQEREILATSYRNVKKQIQLIQEEYQQQEQTIQQREQQLSNLEKRKLQMIIEPSVREKIYEAYELEKKHKEYRIQEVEWIEKLRQSKERIEETQKSYQNEKSQYDEILQFLLLVEQQQAKLERDLPPDAEEILAQKERVEESKYQIKECQQQEEIIQKLKNEYKKTKEEIEEIRQKKEKCNHQLEILQTEKLQDEQQRERYEREEAIHRLRETLIQGEPCSVCGSMYHTTSNQIKEEQRENLDYEKLKEKIISLERQIKPLEEQKRSLENQEAFLQTQAKHQQAQLEEQKSKKGNQSVEIIKQQYQEAEKIFMTMQNKKNQWEEKDKEIKKMLQEKREKKYKGEAEIVKLKERLEQEIKNQEELKTEIELQRIEKEKQQKQYEQMKKELQLTSIEEKFQEIRRWDQELSILYPQEEELRKEIKILLLKKEQYNQDIQKLKEENREIEVLGKEKKERMERLQGEIQKYTQEQEPTSYLKQVKQEIVKIIEAEETLRKEKEQLQKQRQRQLEEQITIEQTQRAFSESKQKQIQRLQVEMEKTTFRNKEEIITYHCSQEQQNRWEHQIKEYEEKEQQIVYHLQKLQEKLTEPWLEEEQWMTFQREKEETRKVLEEKTSQIAITKNQLEQMEEKLKERKRLVQKQKELDYRWGLLDELDKLVQGNRFVEFIAMYQLQYIAKEATKTLKEITRGRYALELDDEGNFIMRDDFNGGTRRNANTLSGGETFLTSLALALALSSQVQLRNQAPLEIFFLDEGFGTLDQDLLDIVIGALERLPSQKLAVGIISHVEELKNRVPAKIIVEPARQGESGTRIYTDVL